jgi:putative glycosyltransferase (TIGR04372 family)
MVISSPRLGPWVKAACVRAGATYDVTKYGNTVNVTAGYAEIQRAWADRPPLLSLSQEHRNRGRAQLSAAGVPPDAWFVCIHSRAPGYATYDDHLHQYRNSDIANYVAAAEALVERGGWCIRLGDRTMPRLPRLRGVVDYAHSDFKSDWMDVFLCASCTFFLGNSSGLSSVSSVFGVPVALANLTPICMLPFSAGHIGIPKLVWSLSEGRYLTFPEAFASPSSDYRFTHLFQEAGLRVDENAPEEIRELAMEMLDRLEGRLTYGDDDERRQAAYRRLFRPGHYSYGAPSRIGRDFLRKYEHLMDKA